MNKTILKFCIFLFVAVALLMSSILYESIPNRTEAYSGTISFQPGAEINFKPIFDNEHILSMTLMDTSYNYASDSVTISLRNISNSDTLTERFSISQSSINGISLGKLSIDDYQMKIIDFDETLNQKLSSVHIDVSTGGPSNSLAWNREMRPFVRIVLLISIIMIAISIFLLKKSARSS